MGSPRLRLFVYLGNLDSHALQVTRTPTLLDSAILTG